MHRIWIHLHITESNKGGFENNVIEANKDFLSRNPTYARNIVKIWHFWS